MPIPFIEIAVLYLVSTLIFGQIVPIESSYLSEQTLLQPHPHQGKLTPFVPGDPKIQLSKDAVKVLQENKPYYTQVPVGPSSSTSRGLIIQDVYAPTKIVWSKILDFNHYPDMVPNTIETEIYNDNIIGLDAIKDHHHHQTMYTRMKISTSIVRLQLFYKHKYYPAIQSMIWTLDYSKQSDVDDSCGFWYVREHPDNPLHWSRVYFSAQIATLDWVPAFIVNAMSKQALTDGVGWVKKFSELEAQKVLHQSNVFLSSETVLQLQEGTMDTNEQKSRSRWWNHRENGNGKKKNHDKRLLSLSPSLLYPMEEDNERHAIPDEAPQCEQNIEQNSKFWKARPLHPFGISRYLMVGSFFGFSIAKIYQRFSE